MADECCCQSGLGFVLFFRCVSHGDQPKLKFAPRQGESTRSVTSASLCSPEACETLWFPPLYPPPHQCQTFTSDILPLFFASCFPFLLITRHDATTLFYPAESTLFLVWLFRTATVLLRIVFWLCHLPCNKLFEHVFSLPWVPQWPDPV